MQLPVTFDGFDDHQRNVLVGTLLGDGSIVGHNEGTPRLSWSHGEKQVDYLSWKASQFGVLFTHTNPTPNLKRNGKLRFTLQSRRHPCFWEWRKLFYSRPDSECTPHIHKKRITPEILSLVNDEALAIWWADDGSADRFHGSGGRRDALTIFMGALSLGEYELVESWFQTKGFHPKRNGWDYNRKIGKNVAALRFSADDSAELALRIRPFLPTCISHKMGALEVA